MSQYQSFNLYLSSPEVYGYVERIKKSLHRRCEGVVEAGKPKLSFEQYEELIGEFEGAFAYLCCQMVAERLDVVQSALLRDNFFAIFEHKEETEVSCCHVACIVPVFEGANLPEGIDKCKELLKLRYQQNSGLDLPAYKNVRRWIKVNLTKEEAYIAAKILLNFFKEGVHIVLSTPQEPAHEWLVKLLKRSNDSDVLFHATKTIIFLIVESFSNNDNAD